MALGRVRIFHCTDGRRHLLTSTETSSSRISCGQRGGAREARRLHLNVSPTGRDRNGMTPGGKEGSLRGTKRPPREIFRHRVRGGRNSKCSSCCRQATHAPLTGASSSGHAVVPAWCFSLAGRGVRIGNRSSSEGMQLQVGISRRRVAADGRAPWSRYCGL